jgi:sugar lactone lactonase YvrE
MKIARYSPVRFIIAIPIAAVLVAMLSGPLSALTGDTAADHVIGQINFIHTGANLIDGKGLNWPARITIDEKVSPTRVYVADSNNHRVLGWKGGTVGFLSGAAADLVIGQPEFSSYQCNRSGSPGANTLCSPMAMVVDSNSNLYIADTGNSRVVRYDSPFEACSSFPCIAGSAAAVLGQPGFVTGGCNNPSHGANAFCLSSGFGGSGLVFDSLGHLYISDTGNSRILEYNNPLSSATPNHVIGQADFVSSNCNPTASAPTASTFCQPGGLSFDRDGNFLVADTGNGRVLEFNNPHNGAISGGGDFLADRVFGTNNSMTAMGCSGTDANTLCQATEAVGDKFGNYYIADTGHDRVTEYDSPLVNGTTASKVIGQGGTGTDFTDDQCDTNGVNADSLCFIDTFEPFSSRQAGLVLDNGLDLFVADSGNNRIVRYVIGPPLNVHGSGVVGQPDLGHYFANRVDGRGVNGYGTGPFGHPNANGFTGVAIDSSVTPNRLYVADANNNRVLAWANAEAFTNGAVATFVIGQHDSFSEECNRGNVGPQTADANTLCLPTGVAVDTGGNLYIADSANNRVVFYKTPFTQQIKTATAVWGQPSFKANACNRLGSPNSGTLCSPTGVAVDKNGNVYIADKNNNRVLEFNFGNDVGANRVFGQSSFTGNLCDKGFSSSPTATSLCSPENVAVDFPGDLFVADAGNARALEYFVPLSADKTGGAGDVVADRVFGQANFISPSCGVASASTACTPIGVAVNSQGDVFVSDSSDNRILEYNKPSTLAPQANRVFGQTNFSGHLCPTNTYPPPATARTLCGPSGLAFDRLDDLFVGDSNDNRVLKYDAP